MIEVTLNEKSRIVDYVVNVLLTTKPAEFMDGHNEDWFFINDKGNVGLNLRHKIFSISLIVDRYAEENNPDLAKALKSGASGSRAFVYEIIQNALGRKAIKDYKARLKNENHGRELHYIEREIARLTARKSKIEQDVARLTARKHKIETTVS